MATTAPTDWLAWHGAYDDPDSSLSRRLVVVRGLVREALARIAADDPAEIRLVSACAGDGRDVLPVLASATARGTTWRLRCRLVELDASLAAAARARAAAAGLAGVEVVTCDAGLPEAYAGMLPAQLVLMCGVLGNISERDVRRTITALSAMTAPGGMVLWTRGRDRDHDDAPAHRVRGWLADKGFRELAFVAPDDATFRVGLHRYEGPPIPPVASATTRLFSFAR
jgi:hypothetical protein